MWGAAGTVAPSILSFAYFLTLPWNRNCRPNRAIRTPFSTLINLKKKRKEKVFLVLTEKLLKRDWPEDRVRASVGGETRLLAKEG